MLIEAIKLRDAEDEDPQIVEQIEIVEIDTSRVTPVNERVGSPIAIAELTDLITQIKPVKPLDSEEPDSYHARNIKACRDGNLSPEKIDFPHHIGLRVVFRTYATGGAGACSEAIYRRPDAQ